MRSVIRFMLLVLHLLCIHCELSTYSLKATAWCCMSGIAQNPHLRNPFVVQKCQAIGGFVA